MRLQVGNRVRILDTAFDEDDGDGPEIIKTRGEIGTIYCFKKDSDMYQVLLDRPENFEYGELFLYSDEMEFINVPENIPDEL